MHLRVILRNIFSNWAGYLVTLLVGFFLAPFVVHHLGNTGYGIWTLVLSLTGYFGMLDLGIRQSVGRYVARYIALDDHDNVNRTISTAFMMLAGGGLLALTATVVVVLNLGAFKIDPRFVPTARAALLFAGLTISCILPMGVFNAVLMSLDRFDVITGVVICGAITRAILVVTFLNLGYGLIALALITLLTSSAEYSAMAVMAKVLYPPLKPGWALIDFARCKELFGFGIYRFIWIVANQVIFYTDSVVLGIFLNVGMITYYAIAGSLINYGRNIVSLAIDTFYPTATKLDAKNDIRGLQELQILGTRIGLLVGLPLCIGFMLLGEQFITLWMGKAYAITATVLIVLTIPQFTSMSQYISALILVGMAKHKVLAYIAAAEGAANLSLSIFLVRKIGLIGVAWGTAIPHAITTAIVIPLYTLHALGMSPWEYFSKSFIRPVISAAPIVGLCYVFSISIANPSWLVFAAEGATVGGTYLALSYFICLTREQQAAVRAKVRRLVRREEVPSKPVGTYGH